MKYSVESFSTEEQRNLNLPLALPPVVPEKLLKGAAAAAVGVGPGAELEEEEAFKTDAKGLPANWRRSSEALTSAALLPLLLTGTGFAPDGTAAAAVWAPKRSKMFGVLFSEADAGSWDAAKGLVAFPYEKLVLL